MPESWQLAPGLDQCGRVFLIRPDGHIAYTGPPHDADGLASYLDRLYVRRRTATPITGSTP
jgi:hypothetical protein